MTTRLTLKKYQNHIIIGAVIAVLLAGVVWSARPTAAPEDGGTTAGSVGALSAETTSYDFGTISMAAGKVNRMFRVRNDGTGPVIVQKLYTSCMCTTATMMRGAEKYGPFGMQGHGFIPSIDQTLASGESVDIEVVFDPTAHGPAGVGQIRRAVYLENNAGKPLELRFSALVTP